MHHEDFSSLNIPLRLIVLSDNPTWGTREVTTTTTHITRITKLTGNPSIQISQKEVYRVLANRCKLQAAKQAG
jgi:hypothetical protein